MFCTRQEEDLPPPLLIIDSDEGRWATYSSTATRDDGQREPSIERAHVARVRGDGAACGESCGRRVSTTTGAARARHGTAARRNFVRRFARHNARTTKELLVVADSKGLTAPRRSWPAAVGHAAPVVDKMIPYAVARTYGERRGGAFLAAV